MLTVEEWKNKLLGNFRERDYETLGYAANMFGLMVDGNHQRPQSECVELKEYAEYLIDCLNAEGTDIEY